MKEDALKDWEPFARNGPGRESQYPATTESPPVVLEKETSTLSLHSFSNTPIFVASPVSATSLYSKLSDEGTRLSTPVDWKPYHLPDPLYDRRPRHENLPKSLDDCLVSQGDTAKARRKRRKRAFEISGDLFIGRNKQLIFQKAHSSLPSELDREGSIYLPGFRT